MAELRDRPGHEAPQNVSPVQRVEPYAVAQAESGPPPAPDHIIDVSEADVALGSWDGPPDGVRIRRSNSALGMLRKRLGVPEPSEGGSQRDTPDRLAPPGVAAGADGAAPAVPAQGAGPADRVPVETAPAVLVHDLADIIAEAPPAYPASCRTSGSGADRATPPVPSQGAGPAADPVPPAGGEAVPAASAPPTPAVAEQAASSAPPAGVPPQDDSGVKAIPSEDAEVKRMREEKELLAKMIFEKRMAELTKRLKAERNPVDCYTIHIGNMYRERLQVELDVWPEKIRTLRKKAADYYKNAALDPVMFRRWMKGEDLSLAEVAPIMKDYFPEDHLETEYKATQCKLSCLRTISCLLVTLQCFATALAWFMITDRNPHDCLVTGFIGVPLAFASIFLIKCIVTCCCCCCDDQNHERSIPEKTEFPRKLWYTLFSVAVKRANILLTYQKNWSRVDGIFKFVLCPTGITVIMKLIDAHIFSTRYDEPFFDVLVPVFVICLFFGMLWMRCCLSGIRTANKVKDEVNIPEEVLFVKLTKLYTMIEIGVENTYKVNEAAKTINFVIAAFGWKNVDFKQKTGLALVGVVFAEKHFNFEPPALTKADVEERVHPDGVIPKLIPQLPEAVRGPFQKRLDAIKATLGQVSPDGVPPIIADLDKLEADLCEDLFSRIMMLIKEKLPQLGGQQAVAVRAWIDQTEADVRPATAATLSASGALISKLQQYLMNQTASKIAEALGKLPASKAQPLADELRNIPRRIDVKTIHGREECQRAVSLLLVRVQEAVRAQ